MRAENVNWGEMLADCRLSVGDVNRGGRFAGQHAGYGVEPGETLAGGVVHGRGDGGEKSKWKEKRGFVHNGDFSSSPWTDHRVAEHVN